MLDKSQYQIEAINAHLDLPLDPGEFEEVVNDHTAEMKTKEKIKTIKIHIVGHMRALIDLVLRCP